MKCLPCDLNKYKISELAEGYTAYEYGAEMLNKSLEKEDG